MDKPKEPNKEKTGNNDMLRRIIADRAKHDQSPISFSNYPIEDNWLTNAIDAESQASSTKRKAASISGTERMAEMQIGDLSSDTERKKIKITTDNDKANYEKQYSGIKEILDKCNDLDEYRSKMVKFKELNGALRYHSQEQCEAMDTIVSNSQILNNTKATLTSLKATFDSTSSCRKNLIESLEREFGHVDTIDTKEFDNKLASIKEQITINVKSGKNLQERYNESIKLLSRSDEEAIAAKGTEAIKTAITRERNYDGQLENDMMSYEARLRSLEKSALKGKGKAKDSPSLLQGLEQSPEDRGSVEDDSGSQKGMNYGQSRDSVGLPSPSDYLQQTHDLEVNALSKEVPQTKESVSRWDKIKTDNLKIIKHYTDTIRRDVKAQDNYRADAEKVSKILHTELATRGERVEPFKAHFSDGRSDIPTDNEEKLNVVMRYLETRRKGSIMEAIYLVLQKEINITEVKAPSKEVPQTKESVSRWDKIKTDNLKTIKYYTDTIRRNARAQDNYRADAEKVSKILHTELATRGERVEPFKAHFSDGRSDIPTDNEEKLNVVMRYLETKKEGSNMRKMHSVLQKEIDITEVPRQQGVEHSGSSTDQQSNR